MNAAAELEGLETGRVSDAAASALGRGCNGEGQGPSPCQVERGLAALPQTRVGRAIDADNLLIGVTAGIMIRRITESHRRANKFVLQARNEHAHNARKLGRAAFQPSIT